MLRSESFIKGVYVHRLLIFQEFPDSFHGNQLQLPTTFAKNIDTQDTALKLWCIKLKRETKARNFKLHHWKCKSWERPYQISYHIKYNTEKPIKLRIWARFLSGAEEWKDTLLLKPFFSSKYTDSRNGGQFLKFLFPPNI